MKITDSICGKCKYFEHECDDEWGCSEYCLHEDEKIHDRFYDLDEIKKCNGYEER